MPDFLAAGTYGLVVTSAAATEPVSLVEMKLWLKVEHSTDDDLISALISAARALIERQYSRQFVTATWRLDMDSFPAWELRLPINPVQSISSVAYTDLDGTTQTISSGNYELLSTRDPAILQPTALAAWPSSRWQGNAVRVTFVAGYGAAASVPETIKTAIKLCVGTWYNNRESVVIGTISNTLPLAVEMLLASIWSGSYVA